MQQQLAALNAQSTELKAESAEHRLQLVQHLDSVHESISGQLSNMHTQQRPQSASMEAAASQGTVASLARRFGQRSKQASKDDVAPPRHDGKAYTGSL